MGIVSTGHTRSPWNPLDSGSQVGKLGLRENRIPTTEYSVQSRAFADISIPNSTEYMLGNSQVFMKYLNHFGADIRWSIYSATPYGVDRRNFEIDIFAWIPEVIAMYGVPSTEHGCKHIVGSPGDSELKFPPNLLNPVSLYSLSRA